MKKTVLCLVLLCLSVAVPLHALKTSQVVLRHSQQDTTARIVIESDEETIRFLNSVVSPASVKIDFPAPFELRKSAGFPFETSRRDQSLMIALSRVSEIRSYKLSAPSRLVIEMKMQPKQPEPAGQAQPGPVPQQEPKEAAAAAPGTGPNAPAEKAARPLNIVIDAGHGGYDTGIVLEKSKEKDLTLLLSRDLNAALAKKGHRPVLTRRADQSLPLSERTSFANSRKPDIMMGVHLSSSDRFVLYTAVSDDQSLDPAVRLYSASLRQGRHLEKSRALARQIGDAVRREFKTEAVFREVPAPLLVSLDAPSVIVEVPRSPDPSDQKVRDRIVAALLKGMAPNE